MSAGTFDYVLVGGGPVGAVMALGLAQQGHDVALIERSPSVADSTSQKSGLGVDARTVALSVASKRLLDRFNAWPETGIGAFTHMEVWEDRGTSVLRFGAEDVSQDALGHIAEVGPWLVQLWEQLESSSVSCFVGQSVTAVHEESRGYTLLLSGNSGEESGEEHSLVANTLIAADGAASVVRRELGVRTSCPIADGRYAFDFGGLECQQLSRRRVGRARLRPVGRGPWSSKRATPWAYRRVHSCYSIPASTRRY